MSDRPRRSSNGLGCLILLAIAWLGLTGYRNLFGEIPYVDLLARLAADYTWQTRDIPFYDLTVSMPPDWTVEEFDRWVQTVSVGGETVEQNCASYILANPENTVAVYLQSPCGFAGEIQVNTCVPGFERVGEKIGRYFSMIKNRYVYTRSGYCTQNGLDFDGQRSVSVCCQDIFFMGHTTVLLEAQYFGPQKDQERLMSIVDRIILSLE